MLCRLYGIIIQERLKPLWIQWFEGTTQENTQQDFTAISIDVPDQTELRSILNKAWDLDLSLVSIQLQDNQNQEGNHAN